MHNGGTPENPLCIRCTSGVPPVYTARTARESGGSVRNEPEVCGFAEGFPAATAFPDLTSPYQVYRFRYSMLLRAMVVGSGSYLKTSTESHSFHPIALTAAAMGP